MKYTKYLRLRTDDDTIITSHTSCILDDTFFEKHTKEGKAEKEFKQRTRALLQEERSIQKAEDAQKAKKGNADTKGPTKKGDEDSKNAGDAEKSDKGPEGASAGGVESSHEFFTGAPGEAVVINERAGGPDASGQGQSLGSGSDSEGEDSEGGNPPNYLEGDSSQEISRDLRESDEEEFAGGSTTLQDKLGGILAEGKKAAAAATKTAKEVTLLLNVCRRPELQTPTTSKGERPL